MFNCLVEKYDLDMKYIFLGFYVVFKEVSLNEVFLEEMIVLFLEVK